VADKGKAQYGIDSFINGRISYLWIDDELLNGIPVGFSDPSDRDGALTPAARISTNH
jgi:hypothetical protein